MIIDVRSAILSGRSVSVVKKMETIKPTINKVLYVSEERMKAMAATGWPLEIRAIFDLRAEVELFERERVARQEAEARWAAMREEYGDEIPF